MSNTKEGGKKVVQSMIEKYGSYEAYQAHMRSIGTKGGHNGTTGGFAANRELARTAGAKGGRISKRKRQSSSKEVI